MQTKRRTGSYEKVEKRYARWAPKYDRRWRNYSSRTLAHAENLIHRFAPDTRSVLDVACGTGLLHERLSVSLPNARLAGVDVSPDMLERAKERLNGVIDWRIATAESLPFDDDTFDVVTCCNAFHLVSAAAQALSEFRRVLQPGGTLIILDWARDHPTVKLIDLAYKLPSSHRRQIRKGRELRTVVEQASFEMLHTDQFFANWIFKLTSIVARK